MTRSDQRLSDVLSEFARTMVTDFPIQGILDRLVKSIVEILPISAAGVTLILPGQDPRRMAASDEAAYRFEELQSELDEGPCVEAVHTGEAVSVPDLRYDHRFRRFAPRAIAEGMAAVYTFPLRHGDFGVPALGALDVYCDVPRVLDDETMNVAQTLADVAAAYLLNAQNRADLQDSSARARELSFHDGLTGLPNRTLLIDRLEHAVQRGYRSGKLLAVLFADLDRFKEVNDTFGHTVGDQLLVAVARRLTGLLRPGDTLARMSGDEFVVLCEDLDDAADAETIAARIGAALETPFDLSGRAVMVSASVGIAFGGAADDVPDRLLTDADTAMYQAKRKGGRSHQIIDLSEQGQAANLDVLHRDLGAAVGRGELRTEYQPIVDAGDGRVLGVEALLRWLHPRRGVVSPSVIVPLAERSGLIAEIGRWVLSRACEDRRGWNAVESPDILGLSVNVSVLQLMSAGFTDTVASVFAETGMDPGLVTLEVTESVFIADPDRALVVLDELKSLGVLLALDDFGTGYASLRYLNRFPFDVVKIDREFVADLGVKSSSHAIVDAIVSLARAMGMGVVAEGVETADQHRLVTDLGCNSCQGYYFARPMPADRFGALVGRPAVGDGLRLPLGQAPLRRLAAPAE